MNNLREVKNDLLKDWIDYRAETIFSVLNVEDKKHIIQYDEITERILKNIPIQNKKYPCAVITSFSAYYYHNLTDVIPDKIYLSTDRNNRMIYSNKIKQIRMKNELYNLGKTQIEYEGVMINIYDKERMLIELAKNKAPTQISRSFVFYTERYFFNIRRLACLRKNFHKSFLPSTRAY